MFKNEFIQIHADFSQVFMDDRIVLVKRNLFINLYFHFLIGKRGIAAFRQLNFGFLYGLEQRVAQVIVG
ncbi:hypothetical protein D3C85_1531990 [compost metagenome]